MIRRRDVGEQEIKEQEKEVCLHVCSRAQGDQKRVSGLLELVLIGGCELPDAGARD